MIKLSVADYCHNCPNFEPEVDKAEYSTFELDFLEDRVHVETVVMCMHRDRCTCQMDYLKKQKRKED